MRDGFLTFIFTASAMAWGASVVDGHHSFAAEFDITKPVTLTGKVTKIEWTNPHAFLFIDVADKQTGAVTNWEIEMGSPNGLTRLGWTRTLLKTGDEVTVDGGGLSCSSPRRAALFRPSDVRRGRRQGDRGW